MRSRMAITKSVAALQIAYEALAGRAFGVPGMALVYGYTGAGKTTAIAALRNATHGVYVRAQRTWTTNAMLRRLMAELGAEGKGSSSDMVDYIASTLLELQRPVFVDEADYLTRDHHMIETLRDIHDVAGVPVVLVGMSGIEKRIAGRNKQLAGRISHWVEFLPSDLEDARLVANAVCEVDVDDELLVDLHSQAKGSLRSIVVGLARIEQLAKANGWTSVDAERWGGRALFIGGAPGGDL